MNERQAREKGYQFSGYYSKNRVEVKQWIEDERKKGNKAILVTVPQHPLSRGYHGTGYSVYHIISPDNKKILELKQINTQIENLEYERIKLLEQLKEVDAKLLKLKINK